MIKKIKNYMLVISAALMLGAPVLAPVAAYAACTNIGDKITEGANAAAGTNDISCTDPGASTTGIKAIAGNIVNIFSVIVGIVAVIMIVYGGFRYITSGGDSGSVGNAKNTLIYAIVGLIIVALAQVIVRFVLSTSSGVTQ